MADDKSVIIGRDTEDVERSITDIDRRSGLYILGIQGSGKTTLLKNLIYQDIKHGHGVFFLDPHGDAIDDLLTHIPEEREEDVIVIDPSDETHTFGMNLFSCLDPDSLRERSRSYAQAEHIFTKLFANPQTKELDILLSQYLPNTFYPLIANQGYTILEIPLLLRDKAFRAHLLRSSSIPSDTLDFWQEEFEALLPPIQREETSSTRRRITLFRSHEYIKHIVGQSETTLEFTDIMDTGKILFVKLSATLAPRVQDIIGTMLISNLVNAVLQRERIPEADRRHFCIFVDEFQRFASSDDFAVLFTQARKYHVATTVAHQERYGQFADNKAIIGATDTAAHKIFLQQSLSDAQRHAVLFAKDSPTETKRERVLVLSQEPVADLLRGHVNPDIRRYVNAYLQYLHDQLEDTKEVKERERLHRQDWLDEVALARASVDVDDLRGVIVQSSAVVAATRAAIRGAQGQTDKLLQLYERSQGLRVTLRFFDRFLTALMEGHISPGQETFSAFLIDRVRDFSALPETLAPVLELYISLSYGDPTIARSIPFAFAKARRLLPEAIATIDKQMEEQERREKEKWVQEQREKYHREHQIELAHRQRNKQHRQDTVLERLREWKLDGSGCFEFESVPPYDSDTEQLLMAYIPLLKYQSVQEILQPYYTARFASPWAEKFPNRTGIIGHLLRDLQTLRKINAVARVYSRRQQRAKRAWFGRGEIQEPPGYTYRENHFADFVLDALQSFLEQYREGAIVVLVLLETVRVPRQWSHGGVGYGGEWQLADAYVYPTYHMRCLPSLLHHEPLAVVLTLGRLAEVMSRLNLEVDCADCYWRTDGENPYQVFNRTKRNAYENFRRGNPPAWWYRETILALPLAILRQKSIHQELEQREDIQVLSKKLSRYPRCRAFHALCREERLVINYLLSRACDIARYGEKVANVAFPQPSITGTTPQEVAETVAWLVSVQQEDERRNEEQAEKEKHAKHEQWIQEQFGVCYVTPTPANLPARVLSANDRALVIKACHMQLLQTRQGTAVLKVIDDFVRFCELLRRPENHIRIPSTQYTEIQVNTYTTQEMTNQMVKELLDLPVRSAYVKSAWKGKIQTLPFAPSAQTLLVDMRISARDKAIAKRILKPRSDIEEEIRERQERWRRGPGRLPPPPTHTGGNNPPSLPTGRTGRTSEPPPTHYIPSTPPEE